MKLKSGRFINSHTYCMYTWMIYIVTGHGSSQSECIQTTCKQIHPTLPIDLAYLPHKTARNPKQPGRPPVNVEDGAGNDEIESKCPPLHVPCGSYYVPLRKQLSVYWE